MITFDYVFFRFFYQTLKMTLDQRRKSGIKRNDLIDLMLAAVEKDNSMLQEEDSNDQFYQDSKMNHKVKGALDETSVIANAMIMFLAGSNICLQHDNMI